MIAAGPRKRRLNPYTTGHLDEVYLKIDGRRRVLVQSKRNKHAACRLETDAQAPEEVCLPS